MMKPPQRSRLGRGLSSLLSMEEPAVQPASSAGPIGDPEAREGPQVTASAVQTPYRLIPLERVTANPHQPRKQMDEAALVDLAASLKANGVIQPIVVREVDGGYQLIAGERRFRAARIAGLSEIPAILREVDGYTQAQMALVENIHRTDLNPLERAFAYSALLNQLGLTQAELATRLGEQRSSVANFLRLLELQPSVQEFVRDGKLSLGHAKVLAGVTDAAEQQRLADLCVSQDLSVRNLERLLEVPTAAPAAKEPEAPSAHVRDLEASLSRQLGLRVQVRNGARKGRGRLVIHYNSLDQFDEFMKRLGVELDAM